MLTCSGCGKQEWVTGTDGLARINRQAHYFCSVNCSAAFSRIIGDETVARAIELRREGETWTFIAKAIGVTPQTIQDRIWRRLSEQNVLTSIVVREIWYPSVAKWRNRQPSWGWLEKRTGMVPH
jgi:hypothetical protein